MMLKIISGTYICLSFKGYENLKNENPVSYHMFKSQ